MLKRCKQTTKTHLLQDRQGELVPYSVHRRSQSLVIQSLGKHSSYNFVFMTVFWQIVFTSLVTIVKVLHNDCLQGMLNL